MNKKVEEILSLRAAGYVKRWHTFPTMDRQTVAEHSAQCLSLLFLLHPNPSINLAKALLWHDHSEREIGDTPAPIKRRVPELWDALHKADDVFKEDHPALQIELTKEEQHWLAAMDVLDLVLWCYDQMMLGNKHAEIVAKRGRGYLHNNDNTPQEVVDFLAHVSFQNYKSFV